MNLIAAGILSGIGQGVSKAADMWNAQTIAAERDKMEALRLDKTLAAHAANTERQIKANQELQGQTLKHTEIMAKDLYANNLGIAKENNQFLAEQTKAKMENDTANTGMHITQLQANADQAHADKIAEIRMMTAHYKNYDQALKNHYKPGMDPKLTWQLDRLAKQAENNEKYAAHLMEKAATVRLTDPSAAEKLDLQIETYKNTADDIYAQAFALSGLKMPKVGATAAGSLADRVGPFDVNKKKTPPSVSGYAPEGPGTPSAPVGLIGSVGAFNPNSGLGPNFQNTYPGAP